MITSNLVSVEIGALLLRFYASQSDNSVAIERRCLLLRGRSLNSRLVSVCAIISFVISWHVSYVFTVDETLVISCSKRRTVIWSETWFRLKKRGIQPTFSYIPFNERLFHGNCKFRGTGFIPRWSGFMGYSSWLIKKSFAVSNYFSCVLTRCKKISFGGRRFEGTCCLNLFSKWNLFAAASTWTEFIHPSDVSSRSSKMSVQICYTY
jgi:hypothetical protein